MPSPVPALASDPAALGALARARMLYTDLDGTLLGIGGSVLVDGGGRPSASTAEAIVAVNAAGLEVVPVSGRNRAQTGEISRLLAWNGFIAELGTVVVPERGADARYFLGEWPDGTVPEGMTPFEVIEKARVLESLQAAFPGRIEPHDPYHADREATHVLRGNVPFEEALGLLASLPVPVALVDNGIIHPKRTTLSPDVGEVHAYHLVPKGVTKRDAVARHLASRGLARPDAIAIGDSAMDVGMAGSVALLVLVGNGLRDSRTIAAAEAAMAEGALVASVGGERGDGWAELAHAWVAAHER